MIGIGKLNLDQNDKESNQVWWDYVIKKIKNKNLA